MPLPITLAIFANILLSTLSLFTFPYIIWSCWRWCFAASAAALAGIWYCKTQSRGGSAYDADGLCRIAVCTQPLTPICEYQFNVGGLGKLADRDNNRTWRKKNNKLCVCTCNATSLGMYRRVVCFLLWLSQQRRRSNNAEPVSLLSIGHHTFRCIELLWNSRAAIWMILLLFHIRPATVSTVKRNSNWRILSRCKCLNYNSGPWKQCP